MPMLTIRTNDDQHARIIAAAKAVGQSYQKWCLDHLVEQANRAPELDPDPPTPEGHIAIHIYDMGQPIGAIFHIPRPKNVPRSAVRATKYQLGGEWYIEDEQQVIATLGPLALFIPPEYEQLDPQTNTNGETGASVREDLHPGDGSPGRSADEAEYNPEDAQAPA